MSVKITAYDAGHNRGELIRWAPYFKLVDQIEPYTWFAMGDVQKQKITDQMLKPYNGRLCVFGFKHIVVEFHSQEDLTQFVLTWS